MAAGRLQVNILSQPLLLNTTTPSEPDDDLAKKVAAAAAEEEEHPPLLEHLEGAPALYRKGGSSFFKTCFNGLNALSGVGIMSIPYALACGGWLSLILLFLIAMATFYTSLLIRKCMDIDPNIRSYPDIGERAFGRNGRMLIVIVMCLELYMVATGFLILEGDNLHNLFPNMALQVSPDFVIGGRQFFVIIVALIILPTVWLDNLSILSYISASGVLASLIILCSITWTGAYEGVGFHHKGTLINWSGIPTAMSLYTFCYCSHPVYPTLYTAIKKKHQFTNVLLLTFILCTFSYASMAVVGYLMFGPNVQSQITLDLPVNKLSSKIAIYTTLVNPISKYALMVTPMVAVLENSFPRYQKSRPFSLLLRTTLVVSTVVVALAVPFFGSLISLVGAALSVTASVLLPCIFYLKISGIYRRFGCELVFISGIIVLGVLVGVFGTYTSVADIIRQW